MASQQVMAVRNTVAEKKIETHGKELAELLHFEWKGLPSLRAASPDLARLQRFEAIAELLEKAVPLLQKALAEPDPQEDSSEPRTTDGLSDE